jgi:D-serine dehydratase
MAGTMGGPQGVDRVRGHPRLREEITRLGDVWLDDTVKGMPPNVKPIRARDIGACRWNVLDDQLTMPLLTVSASAMSHNLTTMQRYCDGNGVHLAPHGKTTMSPELLLRQLQGGAWGVTAATLSQLQIFRSFGIDRILFANEIAGKAHARYVCQLLRDDPFELYSWVDSAPGVEQLSAASVEEHLCAPLKVLIEVGYPGGRTGVRDAGQLAQVLDAILLSKGRIVLAGVSGYEGTLPVERTAPAQERIRAYLTEVADTVDRLIDWQALPEAFLVSAGGSATFDHVVEAFASRWPGKARVILRCGCYLTHDHGRYEHTSPLRSDQSGKSSSANDGLRQALTLWSYVISRPEPTRAFLSFGKRDTGADYGRPRPLHYAPAGSTDLHEMRGRVLKLHDHHAHLEIPAGHPLAVGDRVACGIAHPCVTIDKWRVVYEIDDDLNVVGAFPTFF